MEQAKATALEIMALVDEFPSEPFSFERRSILERIEDMLNKAWDTFEDEAASNYEVGHEVGYSEGKEEAESELEERIQDLEDRIEELESEADEIEDRAFTEGFEAGLRGANAEVIELK